MAPASDRRHHQPRASKLYTPGLRVAMADVMVELVRSDLVEIVRALNGIIVFRSILLIGSRPIMSRPVPVNETQDLVVKTAKIGFGI